MIIDAISDLHGYQPKLQGGDLLIIAGDCTARDTYKQMVDFLQWANSQPYDQVILVAGNHDGVLEISQAKRRINEDFRRIIYLQDQLYWYSGYAIWGSPWTPNYCDWHFMLPRGEELKNKWDMIPTYVDILVTHGPPAGVLDEVQESCGRYGHQGCYELKDRLQHIRPKLHVFGHIHEGYGQLQTEHSLFVNAAIMNRQYKPVNKPVRVFL